DPALEQLLGMAELQHRLAQPHELAAQGVERGVEIGRIRRIGPIGRIGRRARIRVFVLQEDTADLSFHDAHIRAYLAGTRKPSEGCWAVSPILLPLPCGGIPAPWRKGSRAWRPSARTTTAGRSPCRPPPACGG